MEEERILNFLKKSANRGLSITELVDLSKLTRSAIRTWLARLEGGKKVYYRRVGMAKLYYLSKEKHGRK